MKRSSLARTGFKRKTLDEVKATQATKRAKHPLGAAKPKKTIKSTKSPQKGFKVPKWFMSIPVGSHGSNPVQKRYWKVISNFVRQRDFEKYNGKCVSCSARLERWQDGDAAHFKRYSVCNSYFKYNEKNIALSCKHCNHNDDGVVGYNFGQTLIKRYDKNHIAWIEKENLKWRGVKLENYEIVERVEKLMEENPWFVLP